MDIKIEMARAVDSFLGRTDLRAAVLAPGGALPAAPRQTSLEIATMACIRAALAGGLSISEGEVGATEVKDDRHTGGLFIAGQSPGYHAIVTTADFRSQDQILPQILKLDKNALFITEEHVKDPTFQSRLISSADLDKLAVARVYIIDELDGSSSRAVGHYEWSISVGCLENLKHIAGAIFAPKIEGGTLFYASQGQGATLQVVGKPPRAMQVGQCAELKDAYVIFGVDNVFSRYPLHNQLLLKLGDQSRTPNMCGSCALGLAMVAAGRADALVQPIQAPWDWAAGKLLVEEAGGTMLFYEMEQGRIRLIDQLAAKHYDPAQRAVGFIAANQKLAVNIRQMALDITL